MKSVVIVDFDMPGQPIKLPFLWQSSSECVYLRTDRADGKTVDIIIAPNNAANFAKVIEPYASNSAAWSRRLPASASVVLGNEP